MELPQQLFIISDDIVQQMSFDDIENICDDLKELNLYRHPYPSYCVQYKWSLLRGIGISDDIDDEMTTTVERVYVKDGKVYNVELDIQDGAGFIGGCVYIEERMDAFDILIATLATKGVELTTKESKLDSLRSIGKKKLRFKYSTTISIKKSLYTNCTKTGRVIRPHLRRGHIKRVRYGPKRYFVKKSWIEPCFVNYKDGDELHRTHYNVL